MGFLFGVLTAVAASLQNTFFKNLSAQDPLVVNWYRFVISIPVLGILVSLFSTWQMPQPVFWLLLLFVFVPIELLIGYFYVSAFQRSPQSLVGPLFSLSTLFLLPFGFLFLGERPSFLGVLGVISVLLGPFFLSWSGMQEGGYAAGLRKLFSEPGSWRMIAAAFLGACATIFAKVAYQYVPPLLYAFFLMSGLACAITFMLIWKRISPWKAAGGSMIAMSIFNGMGTAFNFIGLSYLFAAYFISIKRLSIVFDVLLGRVVHREADFLARFAGALLMVAGVALIALG